MEPWKEDIQSSTAEIITTSGVSSSVAKAIPHMQLGIAPDTHYSVVLGMMKARGTGVIGKTAGGTTRV